MYKKKRDLRVLAFELIISVRSRFRFLSIPMGEKVRQPWLRDVTANAHFHLGGASCFRTSQWKTRVTLTLKKGKVSLFLVSLLSPRSDDGQLRFRFSAVFPFFLRAGAEKKKRFRSIFGWPVSGRRWRHLQTKDNPTESVIRTVNKQVIYKKKFLESIST